MTDQPLEITNLDALLRERDELRTQLARAENDAEIRLGLAFELGSEKAALLAQRQAALDPGNAFNPVTKNVAVAMIGNARAVLETEGI